MDAPSFKRVEASQTWSRLALTRFIGYFMESKAPYLKIS